MSLKGLIQRNKTLARLVLYSSPLVLLGGAAGIIFLLSVVDPRKDWKDVDFLEFESVRLLQEYLRIDTSYPDGSEIAGAEYLASLFEKEGIDVYVERLGTRNANLWAELPGKNRQALVLHNHIDVIPALRADEWRYDPFGGEIDLPFIYGRGAFDMKSVAIAQAMAIFDLARSGTPLNRSVLFLATGEEERDSYLGTQRVLRQHPELRKRMWGMLTEGGAVEAVSVDEARYWGTSFNQRHFVDIWVCDSDLGRMEDLRSLLDKRQTDRRMTPALAAFFERYGPTRDRPETRSVMAVPTDMLERLRTFPRDIDVTVVPPNVEAMLRSRVVAFPIQKDPEGGYLMRVILHLQSDLGYEDIWDELIGDALDGFTYRIEDISEPNMGSPLDHEIFTRIDAFMEKQYPTIVHGPLSIPFSASDARFFRSYGIPSYGFTPFHILSSDTGGMKGVNERMALPAFVVGVELYSGLVRELVAGPSNLGTGADDRRREAL
ncbi:MAG: M20/M25/M40 family metallo-hydrolase [Acidobacteriota bacterium]